MREILFRAKRKDNGEWAECPNHGCKWLQDCVCCNAYCDAVADFVSTEYCEKCKFYEDQAGKPHDFNRGMKADCFFTGTIDNQ